MAAQSNKRRTAVDPSLLSPSEPQFPLYNGIVIGPLSQGWLWGLRVGDDAGKALSPVLGTCDDIIGVSEGEEAEANGR